LAQDKPQVNPGISLAGAVDLTALKHKVKAEPGQAGGAPSAGGYVIDVSAATFQSVLQTSVTYPVLLLLWVPTDDRLFDMAKTLGEAVNKLEGKMQLARFDINEDPNIAQALQVRGAPALFALIGGQPMPILQGLPSPDEMRQVTDELLPQIVQLAQQAGVTGVAPYSGDPDAVNDDQVSQENAVPAAHAQAHALADAGDYVGAAKAYEDVLKSDPNDPLAARERSKALLLARSGQADVRAVRQAAADAPDDVQAQLAVADVDMIGGQIDDAFARLLDFLAAGHRADLDPVRERLLEYFAIPEPDDPRLKSARRRLSTLMY
jgi:putative thioredoxin